MRLIFLKLLFSIFCSITSLAHASTSCNSSNIELLIGGKLEVNTTQSCFITVIKDISSTQKNHAFKLDKKLALNQPVSNASLKINLYDQSKMQDRAFILNTELTKAVLNKERLLDQKKMGTTKIDELQLNRLEEDISALRRELSR
jgi:hypothetical protein